MLGREEVAARLSLVLLAYLLQIQMDSGIYKSSTQMLPFRVGGGRWILAKAVI